MDVFLFALQEVRFLFPVLLLFNVGAAAFVSRAHLNRCVCCGVWTS